MSFSLSEKIVEKLIIDGTVPTEDKDLYLYGFHQGFLIILNLATSIAIGFMFNMVLESCIFLLTYIPLRSYAGGYHEKTQLRCYMFSVGMMMAVLLGIKLIPWNSFICLIIGALSVGIISLFAPVEDRNKPLDKKETVIYKRRTCIILCALIVAWLGLWLIGQYNVSLCILMSFVSLAFMLVLGLIKNNMHINTCE